jgi:hypothetical protein
VRERSPLNTNAIDFPLPFVLIAGETAVRPDEQSGGTWAEYHHITRAMQLTLTTKSGFFDGLAE